jgi:hypothetical protein
LRGLFETFTEFHVPAGNGVSVRPFVRAEEEQLPLAVENEYAHGWFGIGLVCHAAILSEWGADEHG